MSYLAPDVYTAKIDNPDMEFHVDLDATVKLCL